MPGGPPPTRGCALAGVRAPAWGGAVVGRNLGERGKGAVGPLLGMAAGPGRPHSLATRARALGQGDAGQGWQEGQVAAEARMEQGLKWVAEQDARQANYV